MKKNNNTKKIIKFILLVGLMYLCYNAPKEDWTNGITVNTTDKDQKVIHIKPSDTSYINYTKAWYKDKYNTIGIGGIIDKYIIEAIAKHIQ